MKNIAQLTDKQLAEKIKTIQINEVLRNEIFGFFKLVDSRSWQMYNKKNKRYKIAMHKIILKLRFYRRLRKKIKGLNEEILAEALRRRVELLRKHIEELILYFQEKIRETIKTSNRILQVLISITTPLEETIAVLKDKELNLISQLENLYQIANNNYDGNCRFKVNKQIKLTTKCLHKILLQESIAKDIFNNIVQIKNRLEQTLQVLTGLEANAVSAISELQDESKFLALAGPTILELTDPECVHGIDNLAKVIDAIEDQAILQKKQIQKLQQTVGGKLLKLTDECETEFTKLPDMVLNSFSAKNVTDSLIFSKPVVSIIGQDVISKQIHDFIPRD